MNPEHELSQNQCGQLGCKAEAWVLFTHLLLLFLQNCCRFDAKQTVAKNGAASIFQTALSTFFGPLMCTQGCISTVLNPPWTPEGCRSTKQCLLHCTGTVLARMAACPCVPCP